MGIQIFASDAEGMKRVYENPSWMVGIKNWKPANDIANIDCLERHNATDELFVLLSGSCVLLSAEPEQEPGGPELGPGQGSESASALELSALRMEPFKVYNVPRSLWHNTVTSKDAKLILIEDSSTGSANSDILNLNEAQRAQARALAAGASA
ncbi:MAG TPA: hypothetical protein VIO60_00885 [Rectinemataceae bacterium]